MTNQIKAVAYARVSTREQAENATSIPAQLEAIRNFCKQKGWILVNEFIDAGRSAKTDERPEFQHMIALAKKSNRGFDAIVVHKFDRFSRNREDHVIYKSLLKKIGVHVYSVTEQTDPETPHGFLIEGILEVISEFYNLNLRKEVFKGMTENTKMGYRNGGVAPYGYRLSKVSTTDGGVKTILVLGPEEEVNIVKRIFHMYVYEGHGAKKIASILNEESIPSATGGKWPYTSIHTILHNEVYMGDMIWNKFDYNNGKKMKPESEWIVHKDAHPAIISRETFRLVKVKSKERSPHEKPFVPGRSPFILRGLLKCPKCNANMVSSQSGGKTKAGISRKYYVCGTYLRKGKQACDYISYNKEKIEASVKEVILKEFTMMCLPNSLLNEIEKYNSEKNRELRYQCETLQRDIQLSKDRMKMLQQDLNLAPNNETLKRYIDDLKVQIENNKKQLSSIGNSLKSTNNYDNDIEIIIGDLKNILTTFNSKPPTEQNIILHKYIDKITVNSINNVISIYIKILSPSIKSTESLILLEKVLYGEYLR
ncbi:Site-specific DNA recombinase [Proteiniborus ethanoligenes]|uniref:Site-specific DNA recombinase n=1 Tax=Proteiniborus ethanoligenes TaxID=415015 RepID=A0A1H3RPC9_9FIRM|nr:recombinase family protein [Proteiniborus ethanoligenes]SDZ27091.1 Site-specific DNA recombinase [Proteiniborus ethanoligenes]